MESIELRAIYREGHFDPIDPVRLAEGSEVVITMVAQSIYETRVEAAQQRVYESLLRSYDSGQSDTAARHKSINLEANIP